MPEISRFLGIIIAVYYNDHPPPHFHAKYGEREMKVHIETGEVIEGSLPGRATRLVLEWREIHQAKLAEDWTLAEARKPLNKIEPLE